MIASTVLSLTTNALAFSAVPHNFVNAAAPVVSSILLELILIPRLIVVKPVIEAFGVNEDLLTIAIMLLPT